MDTKRGGKKDRTICGENELKTAEKGKQSVSNREAGFRKQNGGDEPILIYEIIKVASRGLLVEKY